MGEKVLSSVGVEALSVNDNRLLEEWNGHDPPCVNACLQDVVCQRIREHPKSQAVCAWDGNFTYAEIGDLSSRLALQLLNGPYRSLIGPHRYVAVLMEKSRWVVVVVLAILKTRSAYVLLDCTHPPVRMKSVCQDVEAALILASPSQRSQASAFGVECATVDDHLLQLDATLGTCEHVWELGEPSDPMWVVFTSGSTGTPKCAKILHYMFMTGAMANIEMFGVTSRTRWFQFASYAFDMASMDIWLPLIAGGCICIPSEWQRKNGLSEAIDRFQANFASFTPSTARALRPQHLKTLKRVVLGGESMTQADINMWRSYVQLFNGYGPTETGVTYATVQPDITQCSTPSNIGSAKALRCWVTDPDDLHRLMPIGEVGELVFEGYALTDGYVKRPEQTAAAYVDPPTWLSRRHGAVIDKKMYRSGDLVRYNDRMDGTLDFIGRKDSQVKLRGQRIEMGEIEFHVRSCFSHAQDVTAEVVSVEGRAPQLCVFLFCPKANSLDDSDIEQPTMICRQPTAWFRKRILELKSALATRIPTYMIPDHFIPITHTPSTVTGKTDRKKLRDDAANFLMHTFCSVQSQLSEQNLLQPLTAHEKAIQKLWADVLKVPRHIINRHSNWWELGANSVLTIQLVDLASRENLLMNFQNVIESTDLSVLASVTRYKVTCYESVSHFSLMRRIEAKQQDIMSEIRRQYARLADSIEDMYPCTYDQRQSIDLSVDRHANLTLRIEPAELDTNRFYDAWQKTLQASPTLRTQIAKVGGEYFQVVMKDATPSQYSSSRSNIPLDIWALNAPLLQLFQGNDSQRPTILFHHAIHDGFSLELFLKQLTQAYNGQLLPQAQSFASFLQWTQQDDPCVKRYWEDVFETYKVTADAFPPLPHPSYQPQGACMLEKEVSVCKTSMYRANAESKIRLALAIALSQATQDLDVVFGIHTSRRDSPVPGIGTVTGPTLATVPVRVQMEPQWTLHEALKIVQSQARESIPFQCAELSNIRDFSPQTRAACKFQTSLMILPDYSATRSEMCKDWQFCEAQFSYWSLCFVVQLTQLSEDITIRAFFDEKMITTTQVQAMLDRMANTLERIESSPAKCISHIT